MVVPVAVSLIMLADPLVHAGSDTTPTRWPDASLSSRSAVAVAIRVGNSTGTTLLKGAGEHRLVAWVNWAPVW